MEPTQILVPQASLFEAVPEMNVLYRFLPHEDLSVVRWLLQGPPGYQGQSWQAAPDLEELAQYLINYWEDTNTVFYHVDHGFMTGKLVQACENPYAQEQVLRKLADRLYPVLGLPDKGAFVHNVSRVYCHPERVGVAGYVAPDFYAIEIEQWEDRT